MKNKRKLKGYDVYIDEDLTKQDREVQAKLRERRKLEMSKGNKVRIGYRKIMINGEWEYYDDNLKIINKDKMET